MSWCSSYFHHSSQGWPYNNTEQSYPSDTHSTKYFSIISCPWPGSLQGQIPSTLEEQMWKKREQGHVFHKHQDYVIPSGRDTKKYIWISAVTFIFNSATAGKLESFNTSVKFPSWCSFQHRVLCYQPYCWRSVCNSCFSCIFWRPISYSSHSLFFNANNEITDKGSLPYPKTSSVLKYNTLKFSFREEWAKYSVHPFWFYLNL